MEFARTGTLGPIKLGVSRSQIRAEIGPPTTWYINMAGMKNDDDVDASPIWKYDDVELHFDDEEGVWLINFDDGIRKLWRCRALRLDPWVIRMGLPLEDLQNALRNAQISFKTGTYPPEPTCTNILTEGGVQFLVRTTPVEFGSGPGLILIQRSKIPPRGKCEL